MECVDTAKLDEIISHYPQNETSLIMVLQDIHDALNYLPCEALKYVATKLSVPLARVFSVATFYKAFSLKPRGKKVIKVCLGTACHIRGGEQVAQEMERFLQIPRGTTTKDMEYTLETVNCVGACAMAPVVVVNENYYRNVSPGKIKEILKGDRDSIASE